MTDRMPPDDRPGGYVSTTAEPRSTCYRPKGHEGDHGEPIDQQEDETRILYGQCGAEPAPTGIIYASDRGTRWV